jgi:hypothetical protein
MAKATIGDLEGGTELCAWFGGVPSFHDATLRELELRQSKPSRLVAHTYRRESAVDAQGYFVQTRHVDVTLTIFELLAVELSEFMEAGIQSPTSSIAGTGRRLRERKQRRRAPNRRARPQ